MLLEVENGLQLRSLEIGFSEEIFGLVDKNRSRLKKFLGWLDDVSTIQDEVNHIGKVDGETNFAIELENSIIGVIDFHDYDKERKAADIGYWIDIDFDGKGIITKCCGRLIKYGFDELDLGRIIIHCSLENIKSENIAKRVGFEFKGIVKNYFNLYGVRSDSKEYTLTKEKIL